MKSRLAKDTHPKISQIQAQQPKAALTPSQIVGGRLIKANNLEECWNIRCELIKEGFADDIVSMSFISTIQALTGSN